MDTSLAVLLLVVALVIGGVIVLSRRRAAAIQRLKIAYEAALKSGDKQAALTAGRAYYAALRGGKLSTYDEQAITNDLATIR